MPNKFITKTLGCKANVYDTQLLEAELQSRGWQQSQEAQDAPSGQDKSVRLCIVNTCTVTDEADKQSRRMATTLSKRYPDACIVITGCSAEVDPETLRLSTGFHYIIGNRDKPSLVDFVLGALEEHGAVPGAAQVLTARDKHKPWPEVERPFLVQSEKRTRVVLKIQEGCNSFCTFCIIPYARGPSRDLERDRIIENVNWLVDNGTREVVLTGTKLGDYGLNSGTNGAGFVDLLSEIFNKTSLERLRLSSLDPTEITPDLLELFRQEPRLCRHLHISLQSPHSLILRRMKRRYNWEKVQDCFGAIAKLNAEFGLLNQIFVGVDVITGFPGETVDDFAWTQEAMRDLSWSRLHVFPFSSRKGTPASRMAGAIERSEKIHRASVLRNLSMERLAHLHEGILKKCQSEGFSLDNILIEGPSRGPDGTKSWLSGYSPNYLRILVKSEQTAWRNKFVSLRPIDVWLNQTAGEAVLICQTIT